MERDDNVAELFDRADTREDEAYDDEVHKELYDMVERALDECLDRGVSRESLRTLARECGMTKWALERSLRKE